MAVYQPGVPTGLVNLDTDYQNLQDNFTALNDVFGVDHTTFDNATSQKGYHRVIHIINNSGTPATVTNTGQLYTRTTTDVNTDNTLFFKTGNAGGRVLQLTSNFTPTASANGYTFIPGGIIIQWGIVNGTHGSDNTFSGGDTGTVTFATSNIAFPNNVFAVNLQLLTKNAPPSTIVPPQSLSLRNNLTKTGFTWNYVGVGSVYTNFYWVAIGN